VHDDRDPARGGRRGGGDGQVRRRDHAVIASAAGHQRAPADIGLERRRRVAHRLREARQLAGALPLQAHGDQERAGLRVAGLARQQRGHRVAGLVEGEVAAAAGAGPHELDRGREARVGGASALDHSSNR